MKIKLKIVVELYNFKLTKNGDIMDTQLPNISSTTNTDNIAVQVYRSSTAAGKRRVTDPPLQQVPSGEVSAPEPAPLRFSEPGPQPTPPESFVAQGPPCNTLDERPVIQSPSEVLSHHFSGGQPSSLTPHDNR